MTRARASLLAPPWPSVEELAHPFHRHSTFVLAAEVLVVYGRVRLLARRERLPEGLSRLRARPRYTGPADPDVARLIAWRVAGLAQRTLRPLPWDSRCLMSSLTVLAMLSHRGIDTTLVIGVEPSQPSFGAHAWVDLNGRPITEWGRGRYNEIWRG